MGKRHFNCFLLSNLNLVQYYCIRYLAFFPSFFGPHLCQFLSSDLLVNRALWFSCHGNKWRLVSLTGLIRDILLQNEFRFIRTGFVISMQVHDSYIHRTVQRSFSGPSFPYVSFSLLDLFCLLWDSPSRTERSGGISVQYCLGLIFVEYWSLVTATSRKIVGCFDAIEIWLFGDVGIDPLNEVFKLFCPFKLRTSNSLGAGFVFLVNSVLSEDFEARLCCLCLYFLTDDLFWGCVRRIGKNREVVYKG